MRRVLAIDGGGCFGCAPAEVLRRSGRLEWDAYSGTSIGAVLAISLALGLTDRCSADWFRQWMPIVFASPSFWRDLNPRVSKYDSDGLNQALLAAFGNRLFSECHAPTFITSVDIEQATLKVWDSTDAQDGKLLARDVARMAVAAETYFRSHMGYADGGIIANNPAMVLLAATSRRLHWSIASIALVSLGTGRSAYQIDIKPHGELTTAAWAIDVLLHGCSDAMHEYFVDSMAGCMADYVRVQFDRGAKEDGWQMDNPAVVELALKAWDEDINAAAETVRRV